MRRIFALFPLLVVSAVGLRSQSSYESRADFAKYAMKLRKQAFLKVEPQIFVPTTSRASMTRFPWKTSIVTTVSWIGEKGNTRSAWDAKWMTNYGGFDTPDPGSRRNYIPVSFHGADAIVTDIAGFRQRSKLQPKRISARSFLAKRSMRLVAVVAISEKLRRSLRKSFGKPADFVAVVAISEKIRRPNEFGFPNWGLE